MILVLLLAGERLVFFSGAVTLVPKNKGSDGIAIAIHQ